jgi:hypothetical protein
MSTASYDLQTRGSLENGFISLRLMARVRLNSFGLIQSECEGILRPDIPWRHGRGKRNG